jgi:hypothetical protein
VSLGVHLSTPDGVEESYDYYRQPLVPGLTRPIPPGGTLTLDVAIPAPPPGRHLLTLELVAEQVAWFGAASPLDVVVG